MKVGWLVAPAAVALMAMAGLGVLFLTLRTPEAPWGAVSLEFAGSASRAREVIASWTPPNQLRVAAGFGLSFLFLVALPVALADGCRRSAARVAGRAPGAARLLLAVAGVQWLMLATGAVENTLVLRSLIGGPTDAIMMVIAALAAVKFAIAIAGVAGVAAGAALTMTSSR